jgi:uncharacterized protein (DUF952 family)
MLLEIEETQGEVMKKAALVLYPASKIQVLQDLAGKDRCLEVERTRLILHLCRKDEWQQGLNQGIVNSQSLDRDGFIHCSQPDQMLQVANRFYRGVTELVLLWIDPQRISAEIRLEISGGEVFTHIYGPIDIEAVVGITEIVPEEDGYFHVLQIPS